MERSQYVRFFAEIGIADISVVGGKNASLGEMYRKLSGQGVRIPNGFAITADGYRHMLEEAGAWGPLHCLLDELRPDDVPELARRAKIAREIVYGAGIPDHLAAEIRGGYDKLGKQYGEDVRLAVRSSAAADDPSTVRLEVQQGTFLNIRGEDRLLDACRRCFAGLFTERAIDDRLGHSLDHFKVAPSIGVMKMVRSDLAVSGIMSTLDTASGFRDVLLITSAYGLGGSATQGAVDPDEIYIHKPTFASGHPTVLKRRLGDKASEMVLGEGETTQATRTIPTPKHDCRRFCLSDDDAFELTRCALAIEDHFGRPMDVEWAKDGVDAKIYILRARPAALASPPEANTLGRRNGPDPRADEELRQ